MEFHQAKECFINHHRSGVYAASEAGKEIIYLCSILFDFGFEQDGPTKMYEDSRAAIAMCDNPVNRKGSRHIDTPQALHRRAGARQAH